MRGGGKTGKTFMITDVNMRNSVLFWINQYQHHIHKVFNCLGINNLMPYSIEGFYHEIMKHPEIETLMLAKAKPSGFLKKEINAHLRGADTSMPLLKMARERFIYPAGTHEAYLKIRAHRYIDLVLSAFEIHNGDIRLRNNHKKLIEGKCRRPATKDELRRISEAHELVDCLNRYSNSFIKVENKPPILINTFDSEIVMNENDEYELNEEILFSKFNWNEN